MNTIDRVKIITEALRSHRQVPAVQDSAIECLCGWSAPIHASAHLDHQARHIENDLAMAAVGPDGMTEAVSAELRKALTSMANRWCAEAAHLHHAVGATGQEQHEIYAEERMYRELASEVLDLLAAHPDPAAGSATAGEDGTVTP